AGRPRAIRTPRILLRRPRQRTGQTGLQSHRRFARFLGQGPTKRPDTRMMTSDWESRATSPADALALIRSGMHVFVHGASSTPTPLLHALAAREDLENVRLYHLHLAGDVPFARPEFAGRLLSTSLFTGPSLRKAVEEGRADFVPIFLSDIPNLFHSRVIPLDAALL